MAAQDATEDEEAVEDTVVEDEDDEAEVEEDEPTDLVNAHRSYFTNNTFNLNGLEISHSNVDYLISLT